MLLFPWAYGTSGIYHQKTYCINAPAHQAPNKTSFILCTRTLSCLPIYWNKEPSQQMADQEGGGSNKEAIIREHHGKGEQHRELKDAT